ncbi:MAG: M1 family metallopeptidase [Bacteroidota bacterium]|nr:M1 family metallopeptidase [Bacteroidota bacterium]
MHQAIMAGFFLWLLLVGTTAAQLHYGWDQAVAGSCTRPLPAPQSALQRRPYDVLRYDLVLDWRQPLQDSSERARSYRARQTITLRVDTTELRHIELDAHPTLVIDTVTLLYTDLLYTNALPITRVGDRLNIQLPWTLHRGDTLTIEMMYRNLSVDSDRNEFYGGYNRYWQANDTTPLPAPLAYTMSQPNNARRWMPCNDRPYDKALASITILAPEGFTTLSNGIPELTHVWFNGERVSAYRYQSKEPISTYLMVAVASRFAQMERSYASRDSVRHIPLRLFLWHQDSLSYSANAQWLLDATAAMMSAYEHYFVPYPFSTYGQVLLFPYFMGAMEHQTMTTHHRNALVQRWETVVAHELAHHWLGNLVTCATWNDIWLNEGGATYSERLWLEYAYGDSVARRYFAARRDRDYLRRDGGRSQPPVYNTTGTNLFNTGTTYVKAGWIFHMMRTMLGDSAFFALMERYMNTFAYSALETEDMREFFEHTIPNPPVPWRTFFDQWVYSVGHPVLRADLLALEPTASGYRVRLRLAQTQDTGVFLPVYVVPLRLRVREYWSGSPHDTIVLMAQREKLVDLTVPFLPRTVELDPLDEILCEKDTAALILQAEPQVHAAEIRLLPNPVQRGESVIVWAESHPSGVQLRLWRSDGTLVRTLASHDALTPIPTGDLAAGVYILEVYRGTERQHYPLVIVP